MSAADDFREAQRQNAIIAGSIADAMRAWIKQHGDRVPAPDIVYAHPNTPPDVVDALRKGGST